MPDTLTNNAKYCNAYMLKLMSNSTRNIDCFVNAYNVSLDYKHVAPPDNILYSHVAWESQDCLYHFYEDCHIYNHNEFALSKYREMSR